MQPNIDFVPLSIPRPDGSTILSYVCADRVELAHPKPVIVVLHGSGGNSVFAQHQGKWVQPFLFQPFQSLRDSWYVVYIEKRGVQLGDWVGFSGFDDCRPEYITHATREGRIEDVQQVISYLVDRQFYDGTILAVVGHSEGGHVAAGVAAHNPYVTHLGLFPFSAGHGLFEFLLSIRSQLASQKITADEFQQQYAGWISKMQDIQAHPDAIDRQFGGHSYQRWSSYAFGTPLRDLLTVSIPIFLGIGTLDPSGVGTDLAIAHFFQSGKQNLTYRHYINFDHDFNRHDGAEVQSGQSEVLSDLLQWIKGIGSP